MGKPGWLVAAGVTPNAAARWLAGKCLQTSWHFPLKTASYGLQPPHTFKTEYTYECMCFLFLCVSHAPLPAVIGQDLQFIHCRSLS